MATTNARQQKWKVEGKKFEDKKEAKGEEVEEICAVDCDVSSIDPRRSEREKKDVEYN